MNASITAENEAATLPATEPALLKVAIQGYPGAFHDIAARRHFGESRVEIAAAATFEEMMGLVEKGGADIGLMAIENTVAGSIMGNYRLLNQSRLHATGEVYLRIRQNLLALPGQKVEDLTEVWSHPMAIAQCQEFFRQYPHIRLVETEDTAHSAHMIQEEKLPRTGAIASQLAASMYGLDVLAAGIETNRRNYTRFLVLERPNGRAANDNAGKVSLCFTLPHKVGSLNSLLSVMGAYDLNLTKIQSAPIIGKEWEYFFFVDFVIAGQISWQQAVDAIRPLTTDLKVLGAYPQGGHF
ncbi:MAG: prephenate dehydratase, partial [Saprospiraceae bacterium]